MLRIVSSIFPIFAVMFLGTALKRMHFIDDFFIKTSNKLIYYICLPVLLFHKISSASIESAVKLTPILIMLFSIFFVFILSFIVSKLFGWSKKTGGTLSVNAFRGNFAYMGLPVCYYTLGDEALTIGAVFMGFLVPYVNTLSVFSFVVGGSSKFSLKSIVKSTLLNPLFLASIIGLLFSFYNVKVFSPIEKSLTIISQVTLPLALFCIGGGIKFRSIKWLNSKFITGTILKLFILPLIGYTSLLFLNVKIGLTEQILIIMLASPSALINYVMADQMNGEPEMSTGIIILTTLGSIFTYVLWLKTVGV